MTAEVSRLEGASERAPAPAPTEAPATAVAPFPVPVAAGALAVGRADDLAERAADRRADDALSRLRRWEDGGVLTAPAPAPAGETVIGRDAAVVRRVLAPVRRSAAELRAMTLTQLAAHARAEVDGAAPGAVGDDRERLRALLQAAEADDGLVLGGCGGFGVGDLLAAGVGQGGAPDLRAAAYSRSADAARNRATIRIEAPARTIEEALSWGRAILDLADVPGAVLARCIPQNAASESLRDLVAAGAVADLVTYVRGVDPLLGASNGAEIRSFLAFVREGAMASLDTYKRGLPEIRNLHRFTKPQLDRLLVNRTTVRAATSNLPVCVLLQSAFDHNGSFHRDPNLTAVIARDTHLTMVIEGRPRLAEYRQHLQEIAETCRDGKVDEVMISGHGESALMELAGDEAIVGGVPTATSEPVAVADERTTELVEELRAVLRDDPASRLVLNACLTASNAVSADLALAEDPDTAAGQVRAAIAAAPGLATSVRAGLGAAHRARVVGANASFGPVSLLGAGGLGIYSATDPELTAAKERYVEHGTEPGGVLRATLECWAENRAATLAAVERRIAALADRRDWHSRIVWSLFKVVAANGADGTAIRALVPAAIALSPLLNRAECQVARVHGKIPDGLIETVLEDLAGATEWGQPAYAHTTAVLYQEWLSEDARKVPDFLDFLAVSGFTTQSIAGILDVAHLKSSVGMVLLVPEPPDPASPHRGSFLIALSALVQKGSSAPDEAKAFVLAVAAAGGGDFPATSRVDEVLQGTPRASVLRDAAAAAPAPPPAAPAEAARS